MSGDRGRRGTVAGGCCLLAAALAATLLAGGCGRAARDERPETADGTAPAVPGLATVVATVEPVRDVVRAYGAVAPTAEPPEVRDARMEVAQAEARHRLARQQVARLEALAAGAVAPRKELEAARAEEASARAGAARARQVIAELGGDGGRAETGAEETWVIAHVLQADAAAILAAAPVAFTADAFPEQVFRGRVEAPADYVEAATRTAPVRCRVRDPERRLRPGMTGAVAVEVGPAREALVVPAAAVVYDGAQPLVFVEEGAGHYASHAVRVGVVRDARAEIGGAIAPGDRVVTTGAASLLSAARLPVGGHDD